MSRATAALGVKLALTLGAVLGAGTGPAQAGVINGDGTRGDYTGNLTVSDLTNTTATLTIQLTNTSDPANGLPQEKWSRG